MIKGIYGKLTGSIQFNGERLKSSPYIQEQGKDACSYHCFSIVLEVIARVIRQEKEIKDIQIWKEEVKPFLFADDMCHVYRKSQRIYEYKEKKQLTNSEKLQYKMIQNTVLFLYTSSVESKKEIQKTVPFITSSRSIQKLEDLYSENYITVLKEIKEDSSKWKDIFCLWIRRLSIVKMAVLCKIVYLFSIKSVKIPVTFFAELEKLIFNCL